MTREEAFEALFGEEAEQEASAMAVEIIAQNPRPDLDEANSLSITAAVDVERFNTAPRDFIGTLPDGKRKKFIEQLQSRRKQAASTTTVKDDAGIGTTNQVPSASEKATAVGSLRDAVLKADVTAYEEEKPRTRVELGAVVKTSGQAPAPTPPSPTTQGEDVARKSGSKQQHTGSQGGRQDERGQGEQGQQGQNNRRKGRGEQGQQWTGSVESSKPSQELVTGFTLEIISTKRWQNTKKQAEDLFKLVRAGDAHAAIRLEDWQRFLQHCRDSDRVTPTKSNFARYMLLLLRALKENVDVNEPSVYKQRFTDGKP